MNPKVTDDMDYFDRRKLLELVKPGDYILLYPFLSVCSERLETVTRISDSSIWIKLYRFNKRTGRGVHNHDAHIEYISPEDAEIWIQNHKRKEIHDAAVQKVREIFFYNLTTDQLNRILQIANEKNTTK